jgi:drug/metabolite transporter (DMT)-like permease
MSAPAPPTTHQGTLGLLFAFTAVMAYTASQILTRHGVSEASSPLLGSFIALAVGTAGFTALAVRQLREPVVDTRRGTKLFAIAGFFSTLGVIFQFQALDHGNVVLVSPVANTNPLFTLIIASVMLRGLEKLTPQVFLGAGLVVAGVVVLRLA